MKTVETVVRRAAAGDADQLAAIFADSWRLAYRGIIPHLHLEGMIAQRQAGWWRRAAEGRDRTLVLELGKEIGGYVNFGRSRWPLPYEGEIYELYMKPTFQGVGLGEHLFEAARHNLDEHSLKGLIVWALEENEQACEFYRRRGGRPIARVQERLGGKRVPKLGFGWR
jgi:GNAT superfamily N-acetyltransferase